MSGLGCQSDEATRVVVSYTDFIALAPSRQTGGSERNKVGVRDY